MSASNAQIRNTEHDVFLMKKERDEAHARAEAAERRLARAVETLEDCYEQFNFYAHEHEKAGKVEKAATNRRFAELCKSTVEYINSGSPSIAAPPDDKLAPAKDRNLDALIKDLRKWWR